MRKTFLMLAVATTVVLASTATAWAVSATMGNTASDRELNDTFDNFTIVDTNNPAPFDGTFSSVSYFAERVDVIQFVVVDAAQKVTWISEEITPVGVGVNQYTAPEPVGVVAGSNLGVYSKGEGVVSYDLDGDAAPASYEADNAGQPEVGETLTYEDSSRRIYSMQTTVRAASPELCKDGGWESYGYRNQGQCIASVVADERAGK